MSCLPHTRPTVFLRIKTIKATNAVQMLYSISSSKLHHTSGQWCIVISNFLLFNIIFMYCLSHNLLCFFTINSLHKKSTISTPLALIYAMHLYTQHHRHHTSAKQLGCSRSPKMRCIHLVYIYIYHGRCHTANRLRVSKLTQLTIFHRSSPRVYRHGVIVLAVVQLLQSKMRQTRRAVSRPILAVLLLRARKPIETAGENTCSQKRASCLGNSRREREAFSSTLSAARSTREARYIRADVPPAQPPAAAGG